MGLNWLNSLRSQRSETDKPLGGRYKVIRELGSGGFGQTFLAHDLHLPGHPLCVVKQLKPQVNSADEMQVARRLFDTEAKVLYELGIHPQIPRLLAHFEDNQEFYLAQELIDGHPLTQEMADGQPWQPDQVVAMLGDVLSALAFVHQHNVIHRDMKPSNLMRRHSDQKVVLIDFGAVKQVSTQMATTNTGTHTISIGTQGYMPNEQLAGNPRFSSDLYAAGMIAIQALTGKHPRQLQLDLQTSEVMWHNYAPATSPELRDVIDRMVRYDFRVRFPTAVEALEALNQLPDAQTVALNNPVSPPPVQVSQLPTASLPNTPPTPVSSTATGKTYAVPGAVPGGVSVRRDRSVPTEVTQDKSPTTWMKPLPLAAMAIAAMAGVFLAGRAFAPANSGSNTTGDRPNSEDVQSAPTETQNENDPGLANSEAISGGNAQSSPTQLSPDSNQPTESSAETAPNANEPPLEEVLSEADGLREVGEYENAIALYEQVIEQNDESSSAHWGRCYSLNQLGNYSEAIDACNRAGETDPNNAQAYWSEGFALEQAGRFDEALILYERAILINPEYVEAWNNKGVALFNMGRLEEALEAVDQARQLDPYFAAAWRNRGAILWQLGQQDEAIASIEQAIQVDPDDGIAQDLRQQIREQIGR